MSFVGPVNRMGDAFVRPHDIELMLEPNGSTKEAQVDRIVHLGFEVRVEFTLQDGEAGWAQLTKAEADQLELTEGQIVYVRQGEARVFSEAERKRLRRRATKSSLVDRASGSPRPAGRS